MATLSIDIPNAVAQRVLDAFKGLYKNQYDAAKLANPSLTDSAFAKSMVIQFVKDSTAAYEAQIAAEAARQAKLAQVNTDVTIT